MSARAVALKMRCGAGSIAQVPPDAVRRCITEGDTEVADVKQAGRWRTGRASVRSLIMWGVVLVILVVMGKIHACACTGGRAQWHRVYPTSQP